MTIDVDVRELDPANAEVTGIFFADGKKLIGSPKSQTIRVESGKGQLELCSLADAENLAKALATARKIWGLV